MSKRLVRNLRHIARQIPLHEAIGGLIRIDILAKALRRRNVQA